MTSEDLEIVGIIGGVLLAVVILPLWILRMINRAQDRQRRRRERADGTHDEATAAFPAVTDDA